MKNVIADGRIGNLRLIHLSSLPIVTSGVLYIGFYRHLLELPAITTNQYNLHQLPSLTTELSNTANLDAPILTIIFVDPVSLFPIVCNPDLPLESAVDSRRTNVIYPYHTQTASYTQPKHGRR